MSEIHEFGVSQSLGQLSEEEGVVFTKSQEMMSLSDITIEPTPLVMPVPTAAPA